MTTVQYLFPIHMPSPVDRIVKLRLKQAMMQAYYSLTYAKADFTLMILHSPETDLAMLEEIMAQFANMPGDVSKLQRPATIRGYEEAIEWYYNQLSPNAVDYVFINHADDIPRKERVMRQIQSLEENLCTVMSVCGVDFYDSAKKKVTCQLNFKLMDPYGFNVGYPSCWCFAKKRLPNIHFTQFMEQDRFHSDVLFLIDILKDHLIVAVYKPLVEYYYHEAPFDEGYMAKSWQYLKLKWAEAKVEAIPHFRVDYQLDHQPKIMLIGPFNHDYYGEIYADELERLGMGVVRIGADLAHDHGWLNLVEDPNSDRNYRYYSVKRLIDQCQPDLVLLWQVEIGIDFENSSVPVCIVQSEILWKRWPKNANVVGFIYAYLGAPAYFRADHTFDIYGVKQLFLTYAWSPKQFLPNSTPLAKRPIFCGFMGSIGHVPAIDPNNDIIESLIRKERVEYLAFAKKLGVVIRPKALNPATMFDDYAAFMGKCKLAINIASILGCINERQFHVMGMGCVLLQWGYPGLEDLGYRHKENCLIFRSKWELIKCLFWAKLPWNRKKLAAIQKKGMELAWQHTYHARAPVLFQFLLDRMKDAQAKQEPKKKALPPADYDHETIHDLGISGDGLHE